MSTPSFHPEKSEIAVMVLYVSISEMTESHLKEVTVTARKGSVMGARGEMPRFYFYFWTVSPTSGRRASLLFGGWCVREQRDQETSPFDVEIKGKEAKGGGRECTVRQSRWVPRKEPEQEERRRIQGMGQQGCLGKVTLCVRYLNWTLYLKSRSV